MLGYGPFSVRALELPAGFLADTLATNLNAVAAMAVAPDGRIFLAEQTGRLLVWKDGRLLDPPALTLHVADYWERGLIGVTLAPDFPRAPHLFVLYVADKPFVHHVLSRFTLIGDVVGPTSEWVLLEGDDQAKLGGFQPAGHQGGPLRFGHDGKLYVSLGEQTAGEPAQNLDTLQGKILRLNPDGSIPEDNPYFRKTTGKYRAIWALGVRNAFGLAVQPKTGRMFFTDVGGSAFEEVNELVRGANYGWPRAEGDSTNAEFRTPLFAYPPVVGRSVCGGAFYPKSRPGVSPTGAHTETTEQLSLGAGAGTGGTPVLPFPSRWRGQFFFLDYMNHWLKALDPETPTNVVTFARGFNGPVAVEVAPDGSLLVLNRGTIWRDSKAFVPNSGSLLRIRYTGEALAHPSLRPPRQLSATGLFRTLAPLEPRPEFIPFELNAPLWLPGVVAQRWFTVPAGEKIHAPATGEWTFPAGTIFIQHFALAAKPAGRAADCFETHVIWIGQGRCHSAGAYRWDSDGRDATLIEDCEVAEIPGAGRLHWFSPGVEECFTLETVVSGFVLQVNTRQVNRDARDPRTGTTENQLRAWNRLGLLDPPLRDDELASLPCLAPLDDLTASPELRVRSYLDANCAVCHRPGGLARGLFDARFCTSLAEQGLINGELAAGDLGIAGAKVVVPGAPEKSILYQRLKRTDFFRMPPVAVNDTPSPALPLLKKWIEGLNQAAP
jgi:glucose/arabinose dehydrogenase